MQLLPTTMDFDSSKLLVAIGSLLIAGIAIFVVFFIVSPVSPEKFKKHTSKRSSTYKGTRRSFTAEEVAKHNSEDDCWIIVKKKVYDVTPYVEEHPGGNAILNNAGGDSTKGFYGPQHGSSVPIMIEEYCIGELIQ